MAALIGIDLNMSDPPEVPMAPWAMTSLGWWVDLDNKCRQQNILKSMIYIMHIYIYLVCGFKYFLCSPRKLGKIPILTFHIFQSGWFSHQLVLYMIWWYKIISIKFRIGIFVTWGPLTWLHLAVFGHPEVRISCFHFGLGGKSHVRIGKLQKTILVFFSVLASTLMFCL